MANAIFMLDESGVVYGYRTKPHTEPPAKAGGPARWATFLINVCHACFNAGAIARYVRLMRNKVR